MPYTWTSLSPLCPYSNFFSLDNAQVFLCNGFAEENERREKFERERVGRERIEHEERAKFEQGVYSDPIKRHSLSHTRVPDKNENSLVLRQIQMVGQQKQKRIEHERIKEQHFFNGIDSKRTPVQ